MSLDVENPMTVVKGFTGSREAIQAAGPTGR